VFDQASKTVIRVRYADTDQMGVVYHANYLVWFEAGRAEYMRRLGLPYLEFEQNGLFLPVIRAVVEYKSAARYDDEVAVFTRIKELRQTRVIFEYEVRRGEKLLARGSTEHAFTNRAGRPVALRKHSQDLWERLSRLAQAAQTDILR